MKYLSTFLTGETPEVPVLPELPIVPNARFDGWISIHLSFSILFVLVALLLAHSTYLHFKLKRVDKRNFGKDYIKVEDLNKQNQVNSYNQNQRG